MSSEPRDYINRHLRSDCCEAPIMGEDICSDCKEHCGIAEYDEDVEIEALTLEDVRDLLGRAGKE